MTGPSPARRLVLRLRLAGVDDSALLAAFEAIPREDFVEPAYRPLAYGDHPLPLPCKQWVTQPLVVASMTAAISPVEGRRVLLVGSGSGYHAALLAALGAKVVAIEQQPLLHQQAEQTLAALGIGGVRFLLGHGALGFPDGGPYDGIIVAASARYVPRALADQLTATGRLVMPLGGTRGQRLTLFEHAEGAAALEPGAVLRPVKDLGGVVFSLLRNEDGSPWNLE